MKKKHIVGILLIFLAVGLVILAVAPETAWFAGIAVWKLFVGTFLLFWMFNQLIFGKKLSDKLDIFLPIGILCIVFKPEIGNALGLGEDFISAWIIVLVAVILTIAEKLLFSGIRFGDKTDSNNKFSSTTVYFDVLKDNKFRIVNIMGATTVYFQNVDMDTSKDDIIVNVSNKLGATEINVPANWEIVSLISSELGNIESPVGNNIVKDRKIFIKGESKLGEVTIKYV